MIPKSLTLKGVYSYQKEQTIHFDPLLNGQLFGIFGSVGSGKSTILEAITFALYGETDRLNNRDNRNYNMMNLKSDELWIDFVFLNYEEKTYRFTVHARRNKKTFEQVKTYQRQGYVKSGDEWVPIQENTAESITGLTYQNFRRTIIIPQGKFQEFLQLTDKDRTTMMKELFNLDKYEFYAQTVALENANKQKMDNLEGKLSHYEQVTSDILSEKTKEEAEVKAELKNHASKREQQEKLVQETEKIREWFRELDEKQKAFDKLFSQKEQFAERKKNLDRYEQARNSFGDLLNRQEELKKEIAAEHDSFQNTEKKYADKEKLMEQLKADFTKTEKEYQQIEVYKEKLEDLSAWKKALDSRAEIEELEGRMKQGDAKTEKVKAEVANLESELENLQKQIDELGKALPDLNILLQINQWFSDKKQIQDRITESNKQLQKVEEKINRNREDLPKKISQEIREEIPSELQYQPKDLISWLKELQNKTARELKETESELEQQQIRKKLEEFAGELEEGKPCPLCGSKHHPDVFNPDDEHVLYDENQQIKQKLQKQEKACQEAISQCNYALSADAELQKEKQQIKETLQKHTAKLNTHKASFSWKQYSPDDEAAVEQDIQKAQQETKKLKALEDEKRKKETELKTLNNRATEFESLLTDIRNQKIAAETREKTARESLKVFSEDELPENPDKAIKEQKSLENRIRKAEEEFHHLEEKIRKVKDEVLQLKTTLKHQNENLTAKQKKQAELDKQIQIQLNESGFADMEALKTILNQRINITAEREAIDRFNREFYAAGKDLEVAKQKTEGKQFNAEAFDNLKAQLEERKIEEKTLEKRLHAVQHEMKNLEKQLAEKKEMQKEFNQLQKRAENLKTMKQLFKGSGFVNYVSSVFLQELCDDANERFHQLTRQQLQLEVDENNNFRVRDYLNNGRVRSVKTLSGGQTFQASLSLALALANRVQQQSQSDQNFFFLDEGFGTLDKDSLQTVFDTLKTLRHESRIVGVISHVEEMQQEIDMYIKVTNDDENGSTISGSWQ
ncbi:MAG: AAA family ATPase [Bacteroidota bacterium]